MSCRQQTYKTYLTYSQRPVERVVDKLCSYQIHTVKPGKHAIFAELSQGTVTQSVTLSYGI
jgi:hypothetical protein